MNLNELYAERDLLRSKRADLNRKFEALVPLENKNRIAINDALLKRSHEGNDRTFLRPRVSVIELADVPEFSNVRTVD